MIEKEMGTRLTPQNKNPIKCYREHAAVVGCFSPSIFLFSVCSMVANFPHPCTISFGAVNRQHSKRSSAYQDAPCLASPPMSISMVLSSMSMYQGERWS